VFSGQAGLMWRVGVAGAKARELWTGLTMKALVGQGREPGF
jgi:hypothetical protein